MIDGGLMNRVMCERVPIGEGKGLLCERVPRGVKRNKEEGNGLKL